MSKKSYVTECPRCGAHTFEHFRDHAHCPCCLYFEDYYEDSQSRYAETKQIEEPFTAIPKNQEIDL